MYAASALAADDDHWDTQFGAPGADGLVTSIACSGSDVFLTGNFTSAGEAGCIGIAKWNGTNWAGFGSGFAFGSSPVGLAIASRGPEVYVGGAFITNISGVSVRTLGKWDGASWSQVGGGINGLVYKLLFKGNDLYVGGIFTIVGGITVSNIARWDGTNWHALGSGLSGSTNGFGATALAMALDSNGDLIVSGNFLSAGDVQVNNIARWDGNQWHALGSGLFGGGPGLVVNGLAVLNNDVYACGAFKSASGVNATNVARWDGGQWHPMGAGPSGTNSALAVVGTTLYTAGNFTNIGGAAARYVARWNGSAWEALAPGTAGQISTRVSCLASDGATLYAGGDFIQAGNAGTLAVAKWNGVAWSALTGPKSQGAWLTPTTVAVSGNDVYAGGSGLLIAGGLKPNRIAHWNGSAWDDMNGGVSGATANLNSILPHGGNVYVGGNFTNAGGVAARSVAYWDGSSWHAMGSGLNSNVNALCIHNGQLFAGGAFTARGNGSEPLPGIARWNGSEWESVPPVSAWRINNVVNALVTDGVNLYAGGNFFINWFELTPPFNSADVDNVGYWDGAHWWPMGNGLSNTVTTLAFVGTDLYAGGNFTRSGTGATIRRIAKWNDSVWSEVGGGFTNGTVNALAAQGSTLYAGGSFTSVGGVTNLSRLVKWDGTQWQALGSGVSRITAASPNVGDIAISGDNVYVVGVFTHAGGRPSAGIGRWNETMSFVPPMARLVSAGLNGFGQFRFSVSGLSSGPFTIEAATALTNWSSIYSDTVPNTNFTDVNSPADPVRVYRVRIP